MKIQLSIVLLALLLSAVGCKSPVGNQTINFDNDWQFYAGDVDGSEAVDFDDSHWRKLNLPHDWSIEGEFSKAHPSFSRGAWVQTGQVTYRKTFDVSAQQKGKRFLIYFDGAYRNSEVYINGHFLGKRPLGFIAFHYDMSTYLNYGGENVLTVKLDNSEQPGARWYTGTGIYRHVHLIVTEQLYVPVWGNYIVANEYEKNKAIVKIETEVYNNYKQLKNVELRHTAYDSEGDLAGQVSTSFILDHKMKKTKRTQLEIANPQLWSQDHPHLYTICTELIVDGRVLYAERNKTGVRTLEYDAQSGFKLNGEIVKLKGVCLHHAGGPLGAAVHRRTIERQLEKLREMGCNAVRTAHNPFSEEFLDVCDSMGFLVMNEMFDEWELVKNPSTTQDGKKIRIPVKYYAHLFKEWADRDMTDFILRDRNHPSVFMWSIGNEIDQMRRPEGEPIGERLADIVHSLDYRPVSNGVHGYGWGVWPDAAAASTSDVYGYNYIKADGMDKERKQQATTMAIITEHESAQSFYPRSTYLYGDAKKEWWDKLNYKYDEAYEWVESRDIRGESGMEAWRMVKERPYVMGMFIWTGWDYLGEVIPFGWPARSSSFAPIDLAGFPKDGYYFYQSQWSHKPMVHIFPHWNIDVAEGQKVMVYGYTNGDEVELFLNGKSLGKQKNDTEKVAYQRWEVPYHKGELKAVSYRNGQVIAEKIVRTAGAPAQLKVESRRQSMRAGGQDLIYVECTILDADGNVVPTANNLLKFDVQGAARIAGVGNGDNMGLEPFQAKQRTAFNGKCLVILQSTDRVGDITLTISSDKIASSTTKYEAIN